MTITGTLKVKNETVQVSDKFKKREVIVTLDAGSTYPQHVAVQFTGDKCGLIDSYQVGAEVTLSVNLRGREWTSPTGDVKYFNTIEAWKIEGGKVSDESPF